MEQPLELANRAPYRTPGTIFLTTTAVDTTRAGTEAHHRRRLKIGVRQLRQAARAGVSVWLARLTGTREPRGEPLAKPPQTILVCRVNKRLGNTLFTTPLIRSLAAAFPQASIDVLVRDPAHRALLEGLPGVARVIHVPRTLWGLAELVRLLRRRGYDLAIDPSINATSNRIAISLCHARYKLGFAGREQWVRLTHAAAIPHDEPHQARQATRLLQQGIPGVARRSFQRLKVFPGHDAIVEAERLLGHTIKNPARGPVLGFFANATENKQLLREWWNEWIEAVRSSPDAPSLVQILPPGTIELPLGNVPGLFVPELDRLAALLGLLDVFVAADSGPMHLAAAAGTPTIGLFRLTSPRDYAPLGQDCISLGPKELTVSHVAECVLGHLRRRRGEPAGCPVGGPMKCAETR